MQILLLVWVVMLASRICATVPSIVKISGLFQRFNHTSGKPDKYGLQELAAFEMAVKDINAHQQFPNLLPGTKIERAVRELSGEFINAVNMALDVNTWESDGMVGAATNSLSNALAQIDNGFKQNQVAYGSTGSFLSYIGPYPYYFRVCSDDAFQGTALANVIAEYFPSWTYVSVFSTTGNDLGYGSDLFQQFQLKANERNINLISSHQFRSGLSDLSDHINKAKSVGSKVFVLLMQGPDAANLLLQGWKSGLFTVDTQILGSNQVLGPETLKAFPDSATASIAAILKGAMVLRQTTLASYPTDKYKAWVKRWKAQAPTVPSTAADANSPDYDAITKCRLDRDNTTWNGTARGYPLYYGTTILSDSKASRNVTVKRCAGVIFSSFKDDGSDIAPLAPFVYDAVLALAYGIHGVIHQGVLNKDGSRTKYSGSYSAADYYGGDNLGAFMSASDFEYVGITGKVHFRLGDSTGYGYGDRETDIAFELLNFNPGTYCAAEKTGGLQSLGVWNAADGFTPACIGNYANCNTVFNTADGSIPLDRPVPFVNEFNQAARSILIVLAAIVIILVIGFGVMIWYKRANRLVRTYQPHMLYMTLAGFLFGAIRIILASIPFSDEICRASCFVGHLAFMTVFTTLTVKTWRIHIIVNSSFRRIKITTSMVVVASLLIVGAVVVFLIVVVAVGDPHLVYVTKDLGALQTIKYPACTDSVAGLNIALYVIEGLWLAQGARLCWATKDAPDAVNDSGPIATCMYAIIFCSVIVFMLVFLIQLDPQTGELIVGLGFALAALSALVALFLPKAVLLWKGADLNTKMQIIMPDGRTLAQHQRKDEDDSAGRGVSGDKPSYEKDAGSLLSRDKHQNLVVCKEQILRWQKLMMSIESRELIGTGSGNSSAIRSSLVAAGNDDHISGAADEETVSLTGAAATASKFSVQGEP